MYDFKITQKEIQERMNFYKGLKNAPLNFPKRLLNPHYITKNTQSLVLDNGKFWRDRKTFYISYYGNKAFAYRILLLTEFLVRFLEFNNYIFKIDRNGDIYCDIKGIEIHFSFRQAMKRVLDNSGTYESYKKEETDKIVFQMYQHSYKRKEWADTPNIKLEDKMLHIIAYTELYCECELENIIRREAYHKQMEIKKKEEDEIKRLRQLEEQKLSQLITNSEKWDQNEKLLNYLTKRKEFLIENNLYTNEEKEYFEWGLNVIDKNKSDLLSQKIMNT
jgi:hypothetical protein